MSVSISHELYHKLFENNSIKKKFMPKSFIDEETLFNRYIEDFFVEFLAIESNSTEIFSNKSNLNEYFKLNGITKKNLISKTFQIYQGLKANGSYDLKELITSLFSYYYILFSIWRKALEIKPEFEKDFKKLWNIGNSPKLGLKQLVFFKKELETMKHILLEEKTSLIAEKMQMLFDNLVLKKKHHTLQKEYKHYSVEELRNLDNKCLIINFMRARDDPDLESIEDALTSTISIICDGDKQEYLNNIKEYQKEDSSYFLGTRVPRILDVKADEKRTADPYEVYEMAWDDLLIDLNPNDERNRLKGILMIEVQFIENCSMPELFIKGDLEGFKDNDDYMLVNHVHVFFGKDKKADSPGLPYVFYDYFIKNNVALLSGNDKTEYIEKLEKYKHQDYFGKRDNFRSSDTYENLQSVHEILTDIWEDLEPPNKIWESLPSLDVHEWKFSDEEKGAILELKGEIDQKWEFPDPNQFPYY
jgi:hypothetical protein